MKIFGYEIKKAIPKPKDRVLYFHPQFDNPNKISYIMAFGEDWDNPYECMEYKKNLEEIFTKFESSPILSSITVEAIVEILKVMVGEEYCKFELKR